MSSDPTPSDPPIPPAPAEEAPASAEEVVAPPPRKRWLSRRGPAPAAAADTPAPETPAPADGETAVVPAIEGEVVVEAEDAAVRPGRLRRTRKKLVARREVAVYDLGGLAFELYRRDMLAEGVMRLRAQEIADLDDTVRDIDGRLSEVDAERRARRARTPADPSVGCCLVCRTPFLAEARFCWKCGTEVAPPPPADDQPTVAIPTPPAA